jgi:hypothetical protein
MPIRNPDACSFHDWCDKWVVSKYLRRYTTKTCFPILMFVVAHMQIWKSYRAPLV